jgi:hypothetical protein
MLIERERSRPFRLMEFKEGKWNSVAVFDTENEAIEEMKKLKIAKVMWRNHVHAATSQNLMYRGLQNKPKGE